MTQLYFWAIAACVVWTVVAKARAAVRRTGLDEGIASALEDES